MQLKGIIAYLKNPHHVVKDFPVILIYGAVCQKAATFEQPWNCLAKKKIRFWMWVWYMYNEA